MAAFAKSWTCGRARQRAFQFPVRLLTHREEAARETGRPLIRQALSHPEREAAIGRTAGVGPLIIPASDHYSEDPTQGGHAPTAAELAKK